MDCLIIDGYVDEPTCLGVPPFVSTYVRYAFGAASSAAPASKTGYATIEMLRAREFSLSDFLPRGGLAVLVAGNPVPGKYLGGAPIDLEEIRSLGKANPKTDFLMVGPISYERGLELPPRFRLAPVDFEREIFERLEGSDIEAHRPEFASLGAGLLPLHPRFPDLMVELESGEGCPRLSHCSFCIEGNKTVRFRTPEDIGREVGAIRAAGVKHFRIGKQADLLAYGSERKDYIDGFPKPEPSKVRALYEAIRTAAPDLETLHLDNINPGTIARYPDESAEILETIVRYNTPGDVAALGMESADPLVVLKNGLKVNTEQMKTALRIIHSIGSSRENGIPKLLPGINLIRGLIGEGRDTFRLNYEFLREVLDEGILVRRINIRQMKISRHTRMEEQKGFDTREEKKLDAVFRNYREKIRLEVDHPMLEKVFPAGTVFHNTIAETNRGDWTIARPLWSYAPAINLPKILPVLSRTDTLVIGTRERSLVALPLPFSLSGASLTELKQIPGLQKKAGDIIARKLYSLDILKDSPIGESIKPFINL